MSGARVITARAATGVSVLSAALWLGGILVLGAVVAPIVFHEVPAPTSADAMTHVFLRFDRIALGALVVIGISEAVASRLAPPRTRVERVRLALVAVAAVLALVQALWLSPTISDLHQAGAIRGLGDLGLALEVAHHRSELCGKSEVALLAAFLVLTAFRRHEART